MFAKFLLGLILALVVFLTYLGLKRIVLTFCGSGGCGCGSSKKKSKGLKKEKCDCGCGDKD